MDWIHALRIDALGAYSQRHVGEIAYAMATSFVVVVSGPINSFLAKYAGRWNFFVRTLFYVVVFTFGYASFAFWSEKILHQFLGDQKAVPLLVLTFCAFLGFGVWSGQKRNIK